MTGCIDRLRWKATENVIKNTEARYNAICSITSLEQLRLEIAKCFPENKHKVIREFFIKHPVCWTDIQRKIYAIKQYDNEDKKWYIKDAQLWEIYSSFMIRWRSNDIGVRIRELLPDAISKNQVLLWFCGSQPSLLDNVGAQPSLLDEGGYMFSKISTKNRKWYIKKLITTGMIQNIDNCDYDSAIAHMPTLLPKLLRYLKEIFWKSIFIPHAHGKTFDSIINKLDEMMQSGHGWERENAFRIIQSFHAWSSMESIEKYHELASEKIHHIPKELKKIWISVIGEVKKNPHNDATIYSADVIFQWKNYRVEWRAKTVKSILQKMWETEEYTNIDAIRDIVGISFIFPNNTCLEEKKNIIAAFGKLMPDFWFLLKDKWWLWDDIYSVEELLKKQKKSPVHVSSKLDDTTNPEISNTSLSWYMTLSWESLWTEIQFFDEETAEWKKNDDKKYKPKGMIRVLMRWPKFATPKDCYDLIDERIKPSRLKELWFVDINTMLLHYIEVEKFIIPYISKNAEELLFTCRGKEKSFMEKFPNTEKCDPSDSRFWKVKQYIEKLH